MGTSYSKKGFEVGRRQDEDNRLAEGDSESCSQPGNSQRLVRCFPNKCENFDVPKSSEELSGSNSKYQRATLDDSHLSQVLETIEPSGGIPQGIIMEAEHPDSR